MYEQIAANKRRSAFIIAGFVLLVLALAYVFARATDFGAFAVPVAILIATLGSFGSYYYSDSIVLAMSRARPVTREEYPYLYKRGGGPRHRGRAAQAPLLCDRRHRAQRVRDRA